MKFPCTLKNTLLIIRNRFGLPFASKGLGYLSALLLLLSLLACYKLSCYQTTPLLTILAPADITLLKTTVISFCSLLGSTLLLIEKATIDPIYLWVINGVVHVKRWPLHATRRRGVWRCDGGDFHDKTVHGDQCCDGVVLGKEKSLHAASGCG